MSGALSARVMIAQAWPVFARVKGPAAAGISALLRLDLQAGQDERANLIRAILVCLNAFFVAMAFNPVLPGASRSATIFGLYAIAMSLGEPAPKTEPKTEVSATPQLVTHAVSERAAPSS